MHLLKHLRQHGFTLLELMIVLAIAGILVAVAAPSFQATIANNRIASVRDNLATAIKMTRNEAVTSNTPASICPSNDQSSCGGGWNDGWIIFSDVNNNGALNASDGDRLVDVQSSMSNILIGAGSGITSLTFLSNGVITPITATLSIGICDATTGSSVKGRAISVSPIGSLSYEDDTVAGCP